METHVKERLNSLMKEAALIIENTPDSEIDGLLGDGTLNVLFKAIAPPEIQAKEPIYDYLLTHKQRLTLLALIHHVITLNCSIKGKLDGKDCYVAPLYYQWYHDGVMFCQGTERFLGLIGLYQDGKVKFGVAARDRKANDVMGPDDILFLDIEAYEKLSQEHAFPQTLHELDQAIETLESMLHHQIAEEEKYQQYLQDHPWIFGAQYQKVAAHINFDESNIPDFTGIRVRDKTRDIIEIKQPFLPLFKDDGTFRAEFNNAWDQVERYLDFARTERDYLYRQKGLSFDNPHCYLLAGIKLTNEQIQVIRRKERMNPAITVLTYDDLVAMGKNTVNLIKSLKESHEIRPEA